MRRSSLPWTKFTRAALLVVLVIAQSAAVAHEFTHSHSSAQELCATCSFSSNLDGSAIVEHQEVVVPGERQDHATTTPEYVIVDVSLAYFQRAPPISL